MALGIAGLLVVDGVDIGDLEEPGVVRLDLRVQAPRQRLRRRAHLRGGRDGEARAAAAARAFGLYATQQTPSPCRGGTEENQCHDSANPCAAGPWRRVDKMRPRSRGPMR